MPNRPRSPFESTLLEMFRNGVPSRWPFLKMRRVPRCSATNSRPSGAKVMVVGCVRPPVSLDCTKPSGNVPAPDANLSEARTDSNPTNTDKDIISNNLRPFILTFSRRIIFPLPGYASCYAATCLSHNSYSCSSHSVVSLRRSSALCLYPTRGGDNVLEPGTQDGARVASGSRLPVRSDRSALLSLGSRAKGEDLPPGLAGLGVAQELLATRRGHG